MAYNEKLAERIRKILIMDNSVDCVTLHSNYPDRGFGTKSNQILCNQTKVEEKKMMGGLTFMVNGKMCVGILKNDLMVRLNPEIYENALQKKGCREMDFTGRPMKGFVFVGPNGTANKKDLDYWIGLALDFNKKAKASKRQT